MSTCTLSPVAYDHINQTIQGLTLYIHSIFLKHEEAGQDELQGIFDLQAFMAKCSRQRHWTISAITFDWSDDNTMTVLKYPMLHQCLKRHEPHVIDWLLINKSNNTVAMQSDESNSNAKKEFFFEILNWWKFSSSQRSEIASDDLNSKCASSIWRVKNGCISTKAQSPTPNSCTIFRYGWTQVDHVVHNTETVPTSYKAKLNKVLRKPSVDAWNNRPKGPHNYEVYILCLLDQKTKT